MDSWQKAESKGIEVKSRKLPRVWGPVMVSGHSKALREGIISKVDLYNVAAKLR